MPPDLARSARPESHQGDQEGTGRDAGLRHACPVPIRRDWLADLLETTSQSGAFNQTTYRAADDTDESENDHKRGDSKHGTVLRRPEKTVDQVSGERHGSCDHGKNPSPDARRQQTARAETWSFRAHLLKSVDGFTQR